MPKQLVKDILQLGGVELRRSDRSLKKFGLLYSKYKEYTMIPELTFIRNLQLCAHFSEVAGDYVECGVWRGGMSGAIAEVIGQHRTLHLFDSFEGLPPAKSIDGDEALAWQKDVTSPGYYDNCTAPESFVHDVMRIAKVTRYKVYKGWFENTMPVFPDLPIAILRLDGDWYDSTMVSLRNLFPKVVVGGIVILDDYHTWDGCTRAVHDFLSEIKSGSRVCQWENHVAYIQKR